jgi:hypothetical protein
MKILREYIDIIDSLTESKSSDLYHGTSLAGADSILSSKRLEVNSWGPHDHPNDVYPQTVKGHEEAASLTRSFSVAKQYAENHGTGAVLVFDQEALVRDLGRKVRPVDTTPNRPRVKDEELVYGGIHDVMKYLKKVYLFADDRKHLIQILKDEELDTLIMFLKKRTGYQYYGVVQVVSTKVPAKTARVFQHHLKKQH